MKMTRFLWTAAVLACLAAVPLAARAQQYNPGDMPNAVTFSEASYGDIMSRLTSLEAAFAEEKKDDGWKDVSQERWSQRISGRLHMDYWNVANQDAASFAKVGDLQDQFLVRRMRFCIEGTGWGVHGYKVEIDFAGGQANVKDVFWSISDVPVLGRVQFGHFKAPMSLEQLTSSRYISFIERSLIDEAFVPGREYGVAAFNTTEGKRVGWAYGAFFDDIPENTQRRADDRQGMRLVGRLFATPYYDEPSKGRWVVHTGISGMWTDDHDNLIRYRTRPEARVGAGIPGTERLIDTGNFAGDSYGTLGLEAAAVLGSLSLQGEFIYSGANDTAGLDPGYYGAYAYASYFLTGEHRPYRLGSGSFDRVVPHSNFWVVDGSIGPGAWEVLARWSYVDLGGYYPQNPGPASLSGLQNDLTLGVNWYWHPNFRWMLNYVHSWNKYDTGEVAEADFLGVRGSLDF